MEQTALNVKDFPARFFVSGTNTGIGKTVIAAILTAGLRAKYWKPVQSGLESPTDTEWVQQATGLGAEHFFPESFRLDQPLSPHASARLQGVSIKLEDFRLPAISEREHLIVEGAGGLLVPLNEHDFMIDLIKKLGLPLLLVVSSQLGTINHTLLSIQALDKYGVPLLGLVMNGPRNPGNREALEYYGRTRVWAEVEPLADLNPRALEEAFNRYFKP